MDLKDTQCPAKVARREAVQTIHPFLRVADLAFDVNFVYSLKHAGFSVVEIPIEWTDKIGSKVTQSLMRSSFVMLLSVVRLRLFYSPLYNWLQPLRPVEAWLYKNKKALDMVLRGIQGAREGKLVKGPDLRAGAKLVARLKDS